eukprot:14323895-Alexandrium_andersonii.AAC.1
MRLNWWVALNSDIGVPGLAAEAHVALGIAGKVLYDLGTDVFFASAKADLRRGTLQQATAALRPHWA